MGNLNQIDVNFPTTYDQIVERIKTVDPVKYGSSRNYINGDVSYLSPYISRGVISTKNVFEDIIQRNHPTGRIQKFIQELAWRDYWQQIWIAKGEKINSDLKHEQQPVKHQSIPKAVLFAKTGVKAIDEAIKKFYETGYLHNHVRMYIASITCNMGQSHWRIPAQWMYYHLLDADWASNALSWQWVAGANANKKYVANQENINNYCFTKQEGTFLDVPYDDFPLTEIPTVLQEIRVLELTTKLPKQSEIKINPKLPTLIYNYYNLDPIWKKDLECNRILLIEPSHFKLYPISDKSMQFMLDLAQDNISGVQIFVGEFDELIKKHKLSTTLKSKLVYFKEHPTNIHYKGLKEERDWMFQVKGYYPSFFTFWKKCQKELTY